MERLARILQNEDDETKNKFKFHHITKMKDDSIKDVIFDSDELIKSIDLENEIR